MTHPGLRAVLVIAVLASGAFGQLSLSVASPTGGLFLAGGVCPDVPDVLGTAPGKIVVVSFAIAPSSTTPAGSAVPFLLAAGTPTCASPDPSMPQLRLSLAGLLPVDSGFLTPGVVRTFAFQAPAAPPGTAVAIQCVAVDSASANGLVFSAARRIVYGLDGGSSAASATAFMSLQPSASHAAQFAAAGVVPGPTEGHPEGGDEITITGSGFDATDSTVCFTGADGFGGQLTRVYSNVDADPTNDFAVAPLAGGASKITIASSPPFCDGNVTLEVVTTPGGSPSGTCPPIGTTTGPLSYQHLSIAPIVQLVNGDAQPQTLARFAGPATYFPLLEGQDLVVDGVFFVDGGTSPLASFPGMATTSVGLVDAFFGNCDPIPPGTTSGVTIVSPTRLIVDSPEAPKPATVEIRPGLGAFAFTLTNPACVAGAPPADASATLDVLIQRFDAPALSCAYPTVGPTTGGFEITFFGAGFFRRDGGGCVLSGVGSDTQNFPATIGALDLREVQIPAVVFDALPGPVPGGPTPPDAPLAPKVRFVSQFELVVTAPAGLTPGTYALTVYNPDGQQAASASQFTFVPPLTDSLAPIVPETFLTTAPSTVGSPVDFFPPTLSDGKRRLDATALIGVVRTMKEQLKTTTDLSDRTTLLGNDPNWAFPPVIVLGNVDRAPDEAMKESVTIDPNDRARRAMTFVFNTRRPDGSLRTFDFDEVDLPAELTFPPEFSDSEMILGRDVSLRNIPPSLATLQTPPTSPVRRVCIKAAAFQLVQPSTPGSSEVEIRYFHEENYPLVVRSRGDFTLNALVEVSGDSLLDSSPLTNPTDTSFKLRHDYNPAPAGAGLGGRGGSFYRVVGATAFPFSLLRSHENSARDVGAFSDEKTLGAPKPPTSLPAVSLAPPSNLIGGQTGLNPGTRQNRVSNLGALPIAYGGPAPTDEVVSGGKGGGGVTVLGFQGGGGGGGGHAGPGKNGQSGGGGGTPTGGADYGTKSALASLAATTIAGAARPDFFDSEVVGGALFQQYGSLGGAFQNRAASRYDLASPTYPAGLTVGTGPDVLPPAVTVAAAASGITGSTTTPPAFPITSFSGGSGGGGGGASVATFAPWLSIGGRGGNGGGSVVFVSDRIFTLGTSGRILADGEDGRSGLSAFPVFGEPTFVLSAPGSGGGGAGGSIAVFAVADVVVEGIKFGVTPADALTNAGGTPVVSARGGRGGGTFLSTTIPTAEGGDGCHGRVRLAHHEAAMRPLCVETGLTTCWPEDFAALAGPLPATGTGLFARVTLSTTGSGFAPSYIAPRPAEFTSTTTPPLDVVPAAATCPAAPSATIAVYKSTP
jgi:hypothetical protein